MGRRNVVGIIPHPDLFRQHLEIIRKRGFQRQVGDPAALRSDILPVGTRTRPHHLEYHVVVPGILAMPVLTPRPEVLVNFDIPRHEGAVDLELGVTEIGSFVLIPPSRKHHTQTAPIGKSQPLGLDKLFVPNTLQHRFGNPLGLLGHPHTPRDHAPQPFILARKPPKTGRPVHP